MAIIRKSNIFRRISKKSSFKFSFFKYFKSIDKIYSNLEVEYLCRFRLYKRTPKSDIVNLSPKSVL